MKGEGPLLARREAAAAPGSAVHSSCVLALTCGRGASVWASVVNMVTGAGLFLVACAPQSPLQRWLCAHERKQAGASCPLLARKPIWKRSQIGFLLFKYMDENVIVYLLEMLEI